MDITVAAVINNVNTQAELERVCDEAVKAYTIAKNSGNETVAAFWAEVKREAARKMAMLD